MTRAEAKRIVGSQPKWALRNMARALCSLPFLNTTEDWQRLRALRALGYKVTISIPDCTKAV